MTHAELGDYARTRIPPAGKLGGRLVRGEEGSKSWWGKQLRVYCVENAWGNYERPSLRNTGMEEDF